MTAFYSINVILFCMTLFICESSEIKYKHVDLTYELKEGLPMYPGITRFKKILLSNGTEPEGYWLQFEDLSTCVHVGTHMDAPCHFAKGKWCLHEIPFERLIAPAVVIDITGKHHYGTVFDLMPEDLEEWEYMYGKIPDGSILVVKTGWGKFWNDVEKFVNGSEDNRHVPGISPEAAVWLVKNTNIYGVAVETLSVDERYSDMFETHVTLLSANIYAIENLANVDMLPVKGSFIYSMPILIADGSGAPARVFAKIPVEEH